MIMNTLFNNEEQQRIATSAKSIAKSINSNKSDDSSSTNSSAQSSTLSQLAMKRAAQIYQSENDPDQNSLEGINEEIKDVRNVVTNDDQSHASSLTDLTDNTKNQDYHNGDLQSDGSIGSSLSIKSLKESDFEELINGVEDEAEMEANLKLAYKLHQKRQDDKMAKYIEKAKQLKRQKQVLTKDTGSLVRGQQHSDEAGQNHTEAIDLTADKETEQASVNAQEDQNDGDDTEIPPSELTANTGELP